MLLLTATTDYLQLTTGSALSTDLVTSFVDITTTAFTPGSSEQNVSTATTVTLVAAPAASTQRQVKALSIRNNSASTAQTVTIAKNSASTAYNVTGAIALQPGETLYYQDGVGFSVRDAAGQIKQTNGAFATPTAKVGLSAVAGSATSGIRSDGAPALDVTISPTWTGIHTFSNSGATPVVIDGAYGFTALNIIGNTSTNNSYGLYIQAGTSASDNGLVIRNAANSTNFFVVSGNGTVFTGAATVGVSSPGDICIGRTGTPTTGATLFGNAGAFAYGDGSGLVLNGILSGSSYVKPNSDNSHSLGTSGTRWSVVYAATGTINTSDGRLKTQIENTTLGLDFVRKLRPVSYRWLHGSGQDTHVDPMTGKPVPSTLKSGVRTHYGLIAQEVKAALGDTDFAGWTLADTSDPESTQGLRYDQFIAPLIKAVQEIDRRIIQLELSRG